jgi:hypothetical protein
MQVIVMNRDMSTSSVRAKLRSSGSILYAFKGVADFLAQKFAGLKRC